MPVDPQIQRVLDALARLNAPDYAQVGVEAARAWSAARTRAIPPGPAAQVSEQTVTGPHGPLLLRIYRPLDRDDALPCLMYFHGGGFVVGSIDQSDADCRSLATRVPCAVVNVDYALAPERPFPMGLQDAYAALCWVHAHAAELGIDRARLAVAGDSAGGNLAAVVSMLARDRGGPVLAFQLLIYPVTDLSRFDTPSYEENAAGYSLTRSRMRWYASQYLPAPEDARSPLASPLLAPDLFGLPPALVITAEYDPLRDEGEAYARRLAQAKVPVQCSRYPGMIHGFFTMSAYIDGAKRALTASVNALSRAFGA